MNPRDRTPDKAHDVSPDTNPSRRTDRPKVMFLIRSLELGGAERVFATLVNNLIRFDPVVLLHDEIIAPPNRLRDTIPYSGVLPESRSTREARTTFDVAQRFREARRIRQLTDREGCRILSSFLLKSNRVAVFTKLFFAPDLKVVVNVHELMSQQLQYEHPALLERWIHRWISRLIFRRADLIIAVAEGVKRDLVSSFGAPSEKIVVVHNPIDLELIRQRSSEPLEQAPYAGNNIRLVVAVGRLVKLKGFDLLIQAFARPARQFGAKLVIIGDGEERETLQELVTDLGLADSVFLIGERENPWKYMARADLFVLSSLTEAFPSVLGEALAVGKPILATDCSPGVREYLLNGECGQLCTPGDVGSLANGIEQLLADDALCERLTRKAGARVAPFDVPLAGREYEDALATFVEGSASQSQTTGCD